MKMSNPKSTYTGTRLSSQGSDDFQKKTLARIQKIQSQLTSSPRGFKLKNKVCVITGAGSLKGIGRASAMLYAHEGARHIYALDYSAENLPDLKQIIEKQYSDVKVTTIQGDAADESVISGLCKRVLQEEGRLDVFFANAGIATKDPLVATSAETFMETMRINGLSVFLAIKYASAAMGRVNPSRGKESSSGSIILTASIAGIRSGAGTVDYSASKAAVNSMAKTSSYQLQKTNIRVNAVCPGLIETAMTGDTFEFARQRGTAGKIGQLNPLGRYGVAEEVAQVALFLASDDSSYVNGQEIAVDGGLTASVPVVPGRWA